MNHSIFYILFNCPQSVHSLCEFYTTWVFQPLLIFCSSIRERVKARSFKDSRSRELTGVITYLKLCPSFGSANYDLLIQTEIHIVLKNSKHENINWTQSAGDNSSLKRLEERSCLRVSVYLISPAPAYRAVYSLTLCVLSKQEYPGFSWIYFKVNPIITFSFIAKNSLIWILWSECVICFVLLFPTCLPSFINQLAWVAAC